MPKKIAIFVFVFLVLVLLTGCTREIKELNQLDESELYIYKDGQFAFSGDENSSALNYTSYHEGGFLLKYADNVADLETKRGIKIGSSIEEVTEAYKGNFGFVFDSSIKPYKSNALKYHEINAYHEYYKNESIIPLYEIIDYPVVVADYAVEYDVYSTKNGELDYFELINMLRKQGMSYSDWLGKDGRDLPVSRRYIRFYIKDDEVVDIWIWFEKKGLIEIKIIPKKEVMEDKMCY